MTLMIFTFLTLSLIFAIARINWIMSATFRLLDDIAVANSVEFQHEVYDFWRVRYEIFDAVGSIFTVFWKVWKWTPRQIWGQHRFTHGDWLTPQIPPKDLN